MSKNEYFVKFLQYTALRNDGLSSELLIINFLYKLCLIECNCEYECLIISIKVENGC